MCSQSGAIVIRRSSFSSAKLNIGRILTKIKGRQLLGCPKKFCSNDTNIDAIMQTSENKNIIFSGIWYYNFEIYQKPSHPNTIESLFQDFKVKQSLPNFIDAAAYDSHNKHYFIFKVNLFYLFEFQQSIMNIL